MYRYSNRIIATLFCASIGSAAAQHQHHSPAPPAKPVQSPATAAVSATGANTQQADANRRGQAPGIAGYQRFDVAEPLSDWRKVNATVHEIGGWRTYAREAAKANQAANPGKANK